MSSVNIHKYDKFNFIIVNLTLCLYTYVATAKCIALMLLKYLAFKLPYSLFQI